MKKGCSLTKALATICALAATDEELVPCAPHTPPQPSSPPLVREPSDVAWLLKRAAELVGRLVRASGSGSALTRRACSSRICARLEKMALACAASSNSRSGRAKFLTVKRMSRRNVLSVRISSSITSRSSPSSGALSNELLFNGVSDSW